MKQSPHRLALDNDGAAGVTNMPLVLYGKGISECVPIPSQNFYRHIVSAHG